MATPRPHPFFDDKRNVAWFERLPDAIEVARAEGKRVFLLAGGPRCAGTRSLVERSVSKEEIADYLNAHFVAVTVDPAAAEPDVTALLAALPRREPTPLCVYLTVEGRVVHATAGGRPPAVLLTDMLEATNRK